MLTRIFLSGAATRLFRSHQTPIRQRTLTTEFSSPYVFRRPHMPSSISTKSFSTSPNSTKSTAASKSKGHAEGDKSTKSFAAIFLAVFISAAVATSTCSQLRNSNGRQVQSARCSSCGQFICVCPTGKLIHTQAPSQAIPLSTSSTHATNTSIFVLHSCAEGIEVLAG